ncbi:hypothetical protein RND71_042376 [Anisodus tanguticus]|uniref:Sialate O-acetylesterase domain-containing protein n=1 Tax=Anisodus tanguticus TaxID=243964 RepID=A0AAE1QQ36_9SOLA|nr:hypothetical protein RND71_042376 [Anisodus tanguticus]
MVFKCKRLSTKSEEIVIILLFVLLIPYLWMVMMNHKKDIIMNRSTYKLKKQIFILAGQSNMAGQGGVSYGYWDGIVPPECQSNPDVVSLSMSLHWKIAKEPLNYRVDCVRNCGIGPGMAFANAILKKDPNFGVIGLVPCSVSGKGIRRWSRGNSPYDQLLRKVKISLRDGGELRGLLWFHGESDTITKFDATHYKPRLQKFIQDLRTDLNSPLLPLLMVVLHVPRPWFKGKFADIVRQAQIEVELSNVVKVDAKGLPLNPDGIHLTTAAQIRVGNMLADAFLSSNITSPRKSSEKVFHMLFST